MKQLLYALTTLALMICVNAYAANIKHITKPWTITYAKLKTAVSSDDAAHSLVTAVITSGDLKGAELSGELSEVHEKSKIYVLQYRIVFNSMRVAGASKPVKISAYAIDVNAAQKISDADMSQEYLKRNAAILAFSLIQGHSGSWHMMSKDVQASPIMPVQVKINSGTDIGILFLS